MAGTKIVVPFLSVTLLLAGCKLALTVVEGGEIRSSGFSTCNAGTICAVEVDDTGFSETFLAVPQPGWYFEKWNSGDSMLCGGSREPDCTLSFKGHLDSKWAEDMVASPETFYLMPIFSPSSDIITVDGKEWLQPRLFLNLSWSDINARCPEGTCNGTLNGYDMTGWTWASVDDINSLFNYYIGSKVLMASGENYYGEPNSEWAPAFFSDGWLPTNEAGWPRLQVEEGWLRDIQNDRRAYLTIFLYSVGPVYETLDHDDIYTYADEVDRRIHDRGGWFYRTP